MSVELRAKELGVSFESPQDGYHARNAVGFAALPTGVAVEVEAVFEIK